MAPPLDLTSRQAPGWIAGLVDEMLASYVDWRELAAGSRAAYRGWCESPAGETELRFASYLAALDQEESAAASSAGIVRDVTRWIERSASPTAH